MLHRDKVAYKLWLRRPGSAGHLPDADARSHRRGTVRPARERRQRRPGSCLLRPRGGCAVQGRRDGRLADTRDGQALTQPDSPTRIAVSFCPIARAMHSCLLGLPACVPVALRCAAGGNASAAAREVRPSPRRPGCRVRAHPAMPAAGEGRSAVRGELCPTDLQAGRGHGGRY